MVPETQDAATAGEYADPPPVATSTMDAIVNGTTEGLALLLNIVAMLIVLVALVHLANSILGLIPDIAGGKVTLQRMLGIVMAPVCWLMGLPWSEAIRGGELMGIKTVLNELIAYVELSKLPPEALSDRSRLILLYALVRLRQFRLARHHDRGAHHHGAGTARRDRVARAKDHRVGHACDLHHRRDRGSDQLALAEILASVRRNTAKARTKNATETYPPARYIFVRIQKAAARRADRLSDIDQRRIQRHRRACEIGRLRDQPRLLHGVRRRQSHADEEDANPHRNQPARAERPERSAERQRQQRQTQVLRVVPMRADGRGRGRISDKTRNTEQQKERADRAGAGTGELRQQRAQIDRDLKHSRGRQQRYQQDENQPSIAGDECEALQRERIAAQACPATR